jgi:hypothetical protein
MEAAQMSPALFGIERVLSIGGEPPGLDGGVRPRPFGMPRQREQAAVSLLTAAGGKRAATRSPGFGPPGY